MDSSNLIKIVAAFVAGIVIALGGTLIYVRTNEMVHPQPVAHTSPPVGDISDAQNSNSVTGQDASDQATQTPGVSPDDQIPVLQPVPKFRPKKRAAVARPDPETTTQPEVAQDAAPAPAVNAAPQQSPEPSPPAPQPENNPAPPSPQSNPAPQPRTVTLPAGTNVIIRLAETLSPEHNYTGDAFRATLESPIIIDGFIIADKGSKVLGTITHAQRAGRVEGVSELALTLTEINTSDGQRVKIQTSTWDKKGAKSTGEDTAKVAGGAALGAIIGAIAGGGKGAAIGVGAGGAAGAGTVLATRGKTATLPIETRLTFRLANPITITEKLKPQH
ncbi:MAG: hypothetical protein ACR2JB_17070 [Bryobacteraceae bacterium]